MHRVIRGYIEIDDACGRGDDTTAANEPMTVGTLTAVHHQETADRVSACVFAVNAVAARS